MQRIIKGDKVRVISGKDKSKEGIVLSIEKMNAQLLKELMFKNVMKNHHKKITIKVELLVKNVQLNYVNWLWLMQNLKMELLELVIKLKMIRKFVYQRNQVLYLQKEVKNNG